MPRSNSLILVIISVVLISCTTAFPARMRRSFTDHEIVSPSFDSLLSHQPVSVTQSIKRRSTTYGGTFQKRNVHERTQQIHLSPIQTPQNSQKGNLRISPSSEKGSAPEAKSREASSGQLEISMTLKSVVRQLSKIETTFAHSHAQIRPSNYSFSILSHILMLIIIPTGRLASRARKSPSSRSAGDSHIEIVAAIRAYRNTAAELPALATIGKFLIQTQRKGHMAKLSFGGIGVSSYL